MRKCHTYEKQFNDYSVWANGNFRFFSLDSSPFALLPAVEEISTRRYDTQNTLLVIVPSNEV
jgi:hypothetical protein